MAQFFVEADVGDDVGLVPLVGVKPAFGDHALGGEVDDPGGLEIMDGLGDAAGIVIEVQLGEMELAAGRAGAAPLVGQEGRVRLGRAAAGHHLAAEREQVIHKGRARKGIASDDINFLGHVLAGHDFTGTDGLAMLNARNSAFSLQPLAFISTGRGNTGLRRRTSAR